MPANPNTDPQKITHAPSEEQILKAFWGLCEKWCIDGSQRFTFAGASARLDDIVVWACLGSREERAQELIRNSGKTAHASDCATSVSPAEEPGPCDCDAPQAASAGSDLVPSLEERARQWLRVTVHDVGTAGAPHRWVWHDRSDLTEAEAEEVLSLPRVLECFALSVTREREERIQQLEAVFGVANQTQVSGLLAVGEELIRREAEIERLKRELEEK